MPEAIRCKVIVNPIAGVLKGPAKIRRVRQALDKLPIEYDLILTEIPGQAVELTRQAVLDGWPLIVAVGGDGTISEVVNGLMKAGGEGEVGTLGIIPLGTGNDLAYALDLPDDLNAACQRLIRGQTRLLDVGQVNQVYFINNSAVGLEPMVSIAHEKMRWLKGKVRYIMAALKTIAEIKIWSMTIQWDEGCDSGPMILVSVGNSCRTGGAFYMTPAAKMDDGLLDFIYARQMNRWEILKILPRTFTGSHIDHPLITYRRTTTLTITTTPSTPIQADGEVISLDATEINYRIIPQKLRVIV